MKFFICRIYLLYIHSESMNYKKTTYIYLSKKNRKIIMIVSNISKYNVSMNCIKMTCCGNMSINGGDKRLCTL